MDYGIAAKFENSNYCLANKTGVCYSSLNSTLGTALNKCIGNKTCLVGNIKSHIISSYSKVCADEDASFHV